MAKNISMSVIRRLPRYYRFLNQLKKQGVTRVSSTELALRLGLTASQIRQDLNNFGGFGQQGYGYMVEQLANEIGHILGVEHQRPAVLFGVGNLGRAIAGHMDFQELGFRLVGIFDSAPQKIGTFVHGLLIRDPLDIVDFCAQAHPEMAALCTPRSEVEGIVDRLYPLGIHSFWNFSHYDINRKYPDAVCENVHLNDSLLTLCYQINHHGI